MAAADRLHRLSLISGPAGGGKSRWAEHLADAAGLPVTYVATGPRRPDDAAWQERLERHRRRRPPHWCCLEVEGDLSGALDRLPLDHLALVDSLGTWVAAHLEASGAFWSGLCEEVVAMLERPGGPVLIVVEECGWGVVPPTRAGGLFRERLAAIQQRLAERSAASWLVLQGRALDLHRLGQPVPGEL